MRTAFDWDITENEFGTTHLSCGVMDRNDNDVYLEVDESPTGQWDWRVFNDCDDTIASGSEEGIHNAVSAAVEATFDNCLMR